MSSTLSSQSTRLSGRTLPVGAEPQGDRGVHFRVWAPDHQDVQVVFEDGQPPCRLEKEPEGYFSALASGARAGMGYKFSIDGGDPLPDPASRFQPDGPHGFSEVVDPASFAWSDAEWRGIGLRGQIIYELHVGTFTQGGTWRAAAEKLPYLRDTGITLIEIMPVADFTGRFGWGYDGVLPYAPTRLYGTPDDMRAFVDRAHSLGLAVILDVVYNHLGPEGNYLPKFSRHYLTEQHKTDWGLGLNFDGEQNAPVREYFRENAVYWVREFHLDGLRLDATQDIHDESETHILTEMGRATRQAAGSRSIVLIGENEPQNTILLQPADEGGLGLDGLWNDDFHHTAMVALTGKADAYYSDYRGRAQEFLSALKHGFLYQGQWYYWQKKRRGTSTLGLPRETMITFIQNHDQIANSARGQRAHELSSPGVLRAMTAVMLLGPGTPMLFQGEEFGASTPFLYFADHKPETAAMVRQGRLEFMEQWRSLRSQELKNCMADPCSEETFRRSKLNFADVEKHAGLYALHKDLLKLRREDPVFQTQGAHGLDGAVFSETAFVLRFFSPDFRNDRLLVVNLGSELQLLPSPEPLLGCPEGGRWRVLWSTEDAPYGGCGMASLDVEENWRIPGQTATVLYPGPVAS